LGAATAVETPWLEQEGGEFERRDDALGERWQDAGPWLVPLLLPLALAAFRRGLFFVLPLLLINGLALPRDASAGWWEDLWLTKDQQAYRALAEDDAARAAALAEASELAGEAWYRSDEFTNAREAWAHSASADAHYNRGNALARLGEYEAALAAYDEALALQPTMEDALHNREVVERLRQEQERREQEQQEGEQGDSGEGESSEQQEGENAEQSESQQGDKAQQQAGEQDGEQEGEPQQGEGEEGGEQRGEPADAYAEAWSEEDAQAMEQWLRRIPDDPGGLLRRKFRSQHLQRGAPEDEREAW
jgi:Ca-activated chloride channel family protein